MVTQLAPPVTQSGPNPAGHASEPGSPGPVAKPAIPDADALSGNARSRVTVWATLVKARVTALVAITALAGFFAGAWPSLDWILMLHTVVGTSLLSMGAAALNQYLERNHDANMKRTAHRPLPAGRLRPADAQLAGALLGIAGMWWLAIFVNLLTAFLGMLTMAIYVFVYTPLKRRTHLNTIVGAVPGALPPLMGWTAATGEPGLVGLVLLSILFFWQLPHFYAIAWMYQEDYANAGYVMLPAVDRNGIQTGMQAVGHSVGLLAVSLAPFVIRVASVFYLLCALALGVWFIQVALRFRNEMTFASAKKLFVTSIVYLPLLIGALMADIAIFRK